jgi:outer membrane receptor protein involved in Fe transport
MSYLRVATGFRPGGANVPSTGSPPTYGADKTVDYELGLKATLLGDRLTLDGSVFWIDWRNPQITETDPASQNVYFGNAARARSRGLNLEAAFIPWQGMTLSGNAAFTDAVLTQALPADADAFAPAGERLPYSARFTGYLSAEQRFKLASNISPFIAASVTYVGQRFSEFAANASVPRFSLPSYTTLDLRAGAYFGNWSCSVVARNLTDERGWVSGALNVTTDPTLGSAVSVIQPRTVGISAAYRF